MVAVTFGSLAYFCTRLIEQNDKQHQETKTSIETVSGKVEGIKTAIALIEKSYDELKDKGLFDTPTPSQDNEAIRNKLSSALIQIQSVKSEVDKIRPQLLDQKKESYGEILWVKEEVERQNQKLSTMFKTMSKIVENLKS